MNQRSLLTQGWKKLQFQTSQLERGAANMTSGDGPQPLPADAPWQGSWSGGSATSFSTAAPSAGWEASTSQVGIGERASMESEILAHVELEKIAIDIASDLSEKNLGFKNLAIHNEQDLTALTAFQTFLLQMRMIREQYEEIVPPSAELLAENAENTLNLGKGYVALFNDVVKLLKVDIEITGSEITLDEVTLASQVVGHLSPEISVYYPRLVSPFTFQDLKDGEIEAQFDEIQRARSRAEAVADDETKKQHVQAINARTETLLTELLKRDPQTGLMPLAILIRAQGLRKALGEHHGLLYLKITRAGGSTRTIRNFWTLFTGPKFQYTGACIATYLVFDRDGRVRRSRTLHSHSGFIDFGTSNGNNKLPRSAPLSSTLSRSIREDTSITSEPRPQGEEGEEANIRN